MEYYVKKTDGKFRLDRITRKENKRLHLTDSCRIKLPFINGNSENPVEWKSMYDFTRTACVTLRYMMLIATGLYKFHNPRTSSTCARRRNRENIIFDEGKTIKYPARNKDEARRISALFDKLLLPSDLVNELGNIEPGDQKDLPPMELVVMDTHHIFWRIKVNLRVHCSGRVPKLEFHAVPLVAVTLYEYPTPASVQALAEAVAGLHIK